MACAPPEERRVRFDPSEDKIVARFPNFPHQETQVGNRASRIRAQGVKLYFYDPAMWEQTSYLLQHPPHKGDFQTTLVGAKGI